MLDNKNVIPFRRRFEHSAESINNIIEQIARTPVEPGLLQAMNIQIQAPKKDVELITIYHDGTWEAGIYHTPASADFAAEYRCTWDCVKCVVINPVKS